MKILVSAYACEPYKGSEPGIGWNWVRQIARFHETWVITRANNRAVIEQSTRLEPLLGVHFVYFDLPRWATFWKKGRRGIYCYYYVWQCGAYFKANKLHRKLGFDLAHHVTFGKYWAPSFISLLPVPFLWGPVGGGESEPRSLWYSLSLRGKLYELARRLARRIGEIDPFVRITAKRAKLALATTAQTEQRLRRLGCRAITVASHAALPEEEIEKLQGIPSRQRRPFRVVSIGDLLHLKGYHLGLRAFARLHAQFPDAEYWLFGKGPERERLEKLADELGITREVTFWGCIERAQLLGKLGECDVLLHPALHDSSGWASVEAMAAGRPVLCLDLGGTALQVTDGTGIKIPAISFDQTVQDLGDALTRLANDPDRRINMGEAARDRVKRYFNWDCKGEQLFVTYSQLARSTPPAGLHAGADIL